MSLDVGPRLGQVHGDGLLCRVGVPQTIGGGDAQRVRPLVQRDIVESIAPIAIGRRAAGWRPVYL